MAALTLNQVISRIRTLALSHQQVNSFYYGDSWEFDANSDINFPAVFLESLPGQISRDEKLQRYNFMMYVLDRVSVLEGKETYEQEVLSDTSSIAADLIAMMMHFEYEDDWMMVTNSAATQVTEAINDIAAGTVLEIGVNVDFIADRCQVPADDIEFEEDFDMARTKILSYTGTGSGGDSFTVTGLAGKIVLAVYRAGFYKRAITTIPTDSDKIRVVGTDLGSNKGILSSTGAVALQSGDSLLNGEILDFIIWD